MTAIWSKNGYVAVPVEQEHIERALERDSSHCAVAEAIRQQIPDARHICVDLQTIRWTRKGLRYCFLTPHLARDCIVNFDQGLRDLLQPFTLRMRPAIISKSGKKRTHTPTDGELRGTGLTVNKTQLHVDPKPRPAPERSRSLDKSLDKWGRPAAEKTALCPQSKHQLQAELEQAVRNTVAMGNGEAPQRTLENGERNLDPSRSDGFYVPPPKRVPRALVSTAPKGSIPTTLGGKMPPASILSRREFGLRVLRK